MNVIESKLLVLLSKEFLDVEKTRVKNVNIISYQQSVSVGLQYNTIHHQQSSDQYDIDELLVDEFYNNSRKENKKEEIINKENVD
jgi:hypothetical protein